MNASLSGPGAYFTGMTLRNIRCFGPEQAMTLTTPEGAPARWTVILGENGVGKTTLLQMLALLAVEDSGEVEHMLDYANFELFEYRWQRRPPRPNQLSQSLRRSGEGGTATATFREDKAEYRHTIEPGRREASSGNGHPIKYPPFLCGYGANRRLGTGGLRKRPRELRMPFLSLFGDVDLRDAEEWLLQADYAAKRESSTRAEQKRELVEKLLVQLLPDVNRVRIGAEKDAYPVVEAETPYGWVSVRNLSLGYQALIAWMVDLASHFLERFEGSKSPLAEPAVVLVDEIDLHLHPKWQRTLMTYLGELFPSTQFIATAHSPLVAQGAEGANIVVLHREEDHVRIESGPEEIKNWRIDQILTSDLYGLPSARPPHLDSLFDERRKILTKPELTTADARKLDDLEARIGQLPGGESPDELRAMQLIERAARQLSKPRKRTRR
jgi:energy-coupling factor transporter ATP-binding protein EcfA2